MNLPPRSVLDKLEIDEHLLVRLVVTHELDSVVSQLRDEDALDRPHQHCLVERVVRLE